MWCDQSMRLFYMTYVFMVQGRAFTPNSHLAGYCCVGYCHFFYLTISGKRGQCPGLNSQVLRVLKILVAHQLNIAAVFELKYILTIFSFFFRKVHSTNTLMCVGPASVIIFCYLKHVPASVCSVQVWGRELEQGVNLLWGLTTVGISSVGSFLCPGWVGWSRSLKPVPLSFLCSPALQWSVSHQGGTMEFTQKVIS